MKRLAILFVSLLSVTDLLVAQPRSQKTPSECLAQIIHSRLQRASSDRCIDVNKVRKLLQLGADPNTVFNSKFLARPIWYTMIKGLTGRDRNRREATQILQSFLDCGWDKNTVYRRRPLVPETPLSVAIDERNKGLVKLLLNHGATADILALKKALEKGGPRFIKMLLDHGADPNAQITVGDHTESAIVLVACQYNAYFRDLPQEGFRTYFLHIDSLPPAKRSRAIAELLVRHGAVIPSKRQLADLSQRARTFLDEFRPLAAELSRETGDALEGASDEPQVFPRDIRRLITEEMGGSASLSERAGSFGL